MYPGVRQSGNCNWFIFGVFCARKIVICIIYVDFEWVIFTEDCNKVSMYVFRCVRFEMVPRPYDTLLKIFY